MKKLILCLPFILLSFICLSQAPQAFNYQAVIRNTDGTIKANETVDVQISILQGYTDGPSVYKEIHNTETNQLGLVNLIIGEGTTSDDFSSIDWTSGPYFLEITVNGTALGTSQLQSVPYALYARDVESEADGDPTNEIQALSISGTNLTLSKGGGTVTLPSSGSGDNWGTQAIVTDATLTGNGITATPLRIADNAITSIKINDGAVNNVDIANNAVTATKIADGAVTKTKLTAVGGSSGQVLK